MGLLGLSFPLLTCYFFPEKLGVRYTRRHFARNFDSKRNTHIFSKLEVPAHNDQTRNQCRCRGNYNRDGSARLRRQDHWKLALERCKWWREEETQHCTRDADKAKFAVS